MTTNDIPTVQTFTYRAQTLADRPISGTIDAADHADAKRILMSMQLRVVELEQTRRPEARHGGQALRGSDFQAFNQQLAHLIQAGLPVEVGLRLIAREAGRPRLAATINAIADEAERGTPLGEAFEKRRGEFPPLYGQLIDAGVKAGNLPGMLFNLGKHLEMVQRLRAVLWHALAYPAAVMLAVVALAVFMVAFLVPQFEKLFEDFQTTLPTLTLFVIRLSRWLNGDLYPGQIMPGWFWLLTPLLLALAVWMIIHGRGRETIVVDELLMPMPLLGPVLRRNRVARWCDAVRLGVEAGLDLPRAINLAAQAMGSPRIRLDSNRMVEALQAGQPLASLGGLSVLTESVVTAIDLTSRGPNLPTILGNLSEMNQQQSDSRLALLSMALPPIMIVILAMSIGFIVIAMFLPMVKVMTALT